jgi:hypothetical protein
MNRESIQFTVTDERSANELVTLKVTHRCGASDKVTSIDWYVRQDGRWARSGIAAADVKYTTFLPADWSKVPDALLRAMGVES